MQAAESLNAPYLFFIHNVAELTFLRFDGQATAKL